MQDAEPGLVPLSSIFLRLSKEITNVDLQISAMESVLQREIYGRVLSSQQIKDLQGIDYARQTLACLSIFLHNLSEGAASAVKVDPRRAARDLTLSGLADRLTNPESKADVGKSECVQFF
jgi:hypothetical protein